jgi:tetratricopeptide (TPR) repeat protein
MKRLQRFCALVCLLLPVAGCRLNNRATQSSSNEDPCAIAVAPQGGDTPIDREIARLQNEARSSSASIRVLDRLGWTLVSKARAAYDPGYYRLAEQCAKCIDLRQPGSPEAMLLRGHVLHNMHRFREAERLARKLVAIRGVAFDHGLLGDVLMEQGRLLEAAGSYQKMADLKPSLQSYSRAAHLRWLKGDLPGAIGLMTMAARAGSPRDSESVAWCYSRLGLYQLQAGNLKLAARACETAFSYQRDYAPALLVEGRIRLAQDANQAAIESLRRAAALNPLPEYLWTLADALRAAGIEEEACRVEMQLERDGPVHDPRTFALFLATRGKEPGKAVQLAREELDARSDVFTMDAVAWALAAAGQFDEARATISLALAHGTRDARLFYHAGIIAAASGRRGEARRWLKQSAGIQQMLLPSERMSLEKQLQNSM